MPWTSAPDVETWNNVWTGISRLRQRAVETIREIDFPVVFDRSSRAVCRCCDISQLSMGIRVSAVMLFGEHLLSVSGLAVRFEHEVLSVECAYLPMAIVSGTVTKREIVERSRIDADSASIALYLAANKTTVVAMGKLQQTRASRAKGPFTWSR